MSLTIEKTAKVANQKIITKTNLKQLDLDALSKAGEVLDRGGLTKAGRAFQKHGDRAGSIFPKASGNIKNINKQGQFHLEDILTHPKSISKCHYRQRYGHVVDITIPNDRGVRFSSVNEFIMFLEP